MSKKRILHKFTISEISGVDRPCQTSAKMTIMKRDDEHEDDMSKIDDLENQIDKLEKQVDHLTKQLADRADESGLGTTFDALVKAEIARGTPASVAGAKVMNFYGAKPDASALRKSASSAVSDFRSAVDEVMIEKRLTRSAAMTEVRRRSPDLFAKFQEA